MAPCQKVGSGNDPESEPESDPLCGGQVSENTRKTNGFWLISGNPWDAFWAPFRSHFWGHLWDPPFSEISEIIGSGHHQKQFPKEMACGFWIWDDFAQIIIRKLYENYTKTIRKLDENYTTQVAARNGAQRNGSTTVTIDARIEVTRNR